MFLTWQTWRVIGSTFQKDSEEDAGGLTVGGREERVACVHHGFSFVERLVGHSRECI